MQIADRGTSGGTLAPKATRRKVLKWGFLGTLLATVGGGGAAFLAFLNPKTGAFDDEITMQGTLEDYPVGAIERVSEGKFYLSHVPDGLLALHWKCAHLGCAVPWKPDEEFQGTMGVFHCPCHESIYLSNGQNVAGPAPRPLDLMEVEVLSGGKIVVKTGKVHQRDRYEPSQALKV